MSNDVKDRLDLKALVDRFSVLADEKDVDTQITLFTEDATVDSFMGDHLISSLRGRDQIHDAFSSFLAGFTAVYHANAQQVVDVHGDAASGTSYCQVVLVRTDAGKVVISYQGVRYEDTYHRVDGSWLIAARVARFAYSDVREVGR